MVSKGATGATDRPEATDRVGAQLVARLPRGRAFARRTACRDRRAAVGVPICSSSRSRVANNMGRQTCRLYVAELLDSPYASAASRRKGSHAAHPTWRTSARRRPDEDRPLRSLNLGQPETVRMAMAGKMGISPRLSLPWAAKRHTRRTFLGGSSGGMASWRRIHAVRRFR